MARAIPANAATSSTVSVCSPTAAPTAATEGNLPTSAATWGHVSRRADRPINRGVCLDSVASTGTIPSAPYSPGSCTYSEANAQKYVNDSPASTMGTARPSSPRAADRAAAVDGWLNCVKCAASAGLLRWGSARLSRPILDS
mmetsp:Transcript_11445/g.29237  ORF Transcript_11445/g.29237 Transcript_11445/m.29237 type:complete len:142 (-) Transcript_11445:17-442(-)